MAYMSITVAVVLGALGVEMDGLHGPHEGVSHPHPVLPRQDWLETTSKAAAVSTFMTTSRSWADTTPSRTRRQHSLSRAYWGGGRSLEPQGGGGGGVGGGGVGQLGVVGIRPYYQG